MTANLFFTWASYIKEIDIQAELAKIELKRNVLFNFCQLASNPHNLENSSTATSNGKKSSSYLGILHERNKHSGWVGENRIGKKVSLRLLLIYFSSAKNVHSFSLINLGNSSAARKVVQLLGWLRTNLVSVGYVS